MPVSAANEPFAARGRAADAPTRPQASLRLGFDAQIAARAREKRVADYELARLFAQVAEHRLFREFGYANLVDYAGERHGFGKAVTHSLRRIGETFDTLPVLNQAMAAGELDRTKARDLLRIVTPETEAAWVAFAKDATNRTLEAAIGASQEGLPPSHVGPTDLPEQVRLMFRMTPEQAEMVRTLLQVVRSSCGPGTEAIEDGALLAMVAQRALTDLDPEMAPTPDRSRFVVVNHPETPRTERTVLQAQACCDAEIVEMGPGPKRGRMSHSIPPTVRRAVLHRDQLRCQIPGCSNRLWLDIHHVVARADGGSHVESNLLTTCCVHHDLIHLGKLEVTQEEGRFRFLFPDGRQLYVQVDSPSPVAKRSARSTSLSPSAARPTEHGASGG